MKTCTKCKEEVTKTFKLNTNNEKMELCAACFKRAVGTKAVVLKGGK